MSSSLATELVIPSKYTIVSPICYVSWDETKSSSDFSLSIPHAVKGVVDSNIFTILSMTLDIFKSDFSFYGHTEYPQNMKLKKITVKSCTVHSNLLEFQSTISKPSLFAVAIKNKSSTLVPKHIPVLSCILYCVCKKTPISPSLITLKLYVGMNLKTVQKVYKISNYNDYISYVVMFSSEKYL